MNPSEHSIQNPITEDDIANFLANTPDFFERHAELLATVQLSSGHGSRAVSLQERQAGMLRDKIKVLESRVVDMIRHGQENVGIADKLQQCTLNLLLTAHARDLPDTIVREIQTQFAVPQAAIKVWHVNGIFSDENFSTGVSEDTQAFASSLTTPYCGVNSGFEAVSWLPDPAQALSVALIPLRPGKSPQAFGMLVLASPDPERFSSGMGTDFLERIGELAGAALSRLRPAASAA
ncbi:MAG: DUF484 family protein [Polaromonas sp.]|uniref:DUF484 family protein n=1 Tax=Polaromonas sp. TaxID=1869339 RepID=UPI00271DA0E0|nr:DUF484 family protein [Polaromonas sp.]MDO9114583.1 DUF484 family protein [Polaromonas sp.]MDP1889036.1 DUF484 family protein [Polaromonas sp.]MDP2448572.1 DUF484 family protein [Polaromonas sp.]MDP3249760.1 DUF484 family protein [Polaromonas sp.]MDP3751231.1 DUF484 family protein [Polaromonas sp.]